VHSGGVAGFPLPVLRYVVSTGGSELLPTTEPGAVLLIAPDINAAVESQTTIEFSWTEVARAEVYRLEVETEDGRRVLAALRPRGLAVYRAPPWLVERSAPARTLRWRVSAIALDGSVLTQSKWRMLALAPR
jgi:hypothetical protein